MELVKVDPKEYGLDVEKASGIEKSFLPKIVERDGYVSVYENILTKEISKELCSEAYELGKKLVKVRTGISEIHKTEKAYYLAAGRFVDALKNKLTLPVEQMEEKLKEITNYYENLEKEAKEKLRLERWELVKPYSEIEPHGLGDMDSETFDIMFTGWKAKHDAKIKAEKEAEILRLENEAKEKAERERVIKENEALQAQLKKEREDAELKQKAIEDAAKKEREAIEKANAIEKAKQDATLAEQKRLADIEAKKQAELLAKKEAELKAIEDAKIKAENQKIEAERLAKIEAEKLAKAPIKKQLNAWIETFEIQETNINHEKATLIKDKFKAFKDWAKSEINNI